MKMPKEQLTSSFPRTQLAVCAPGFPGRTTAFLLSDLHHFLCDGFTHVVPYDSEAKSLSRI